MKDSIDFDLLGELMRRTAIQHTIERYTEMNKVVEFVARGVPQPGGSKRAFINKHTGRLVVVDDNPKAKRWKRIVAVAADDAMKLAGREVVADLPLEVTFLFGMPRPKAHWKKSGGLTASARPWPSVRPDTTKLIRSTEDALTGVVWADDAQVVRQYATKQYAPTQDDEGFCVVIVKEVRDA